MPMSLLSSVVSSAMLLTLLACSSGCNDGADEPAAGPLQLAAPATVPVADQPDVLVTVNGVPIREADLQFVLARKDRGRGRGADQATAKDALDKIIDQEVARQQAQALGLDTDPEHQRKVRFMQAPVNDFHRSSLAKLLFQRVAAETAKVQPVEVRQYFNDNRERFQTDFHVFQILLKNNEAKIRQLKKMIDGGTAFEVAAATIFDSKRIAAGAKPWDLGVLTWKQLPVPWQAVIDKMKEGEVSAIVRGPNKRTWIIKLIKRTLNESRTFEVLEPELTQMMQNAKAKAQREAAAKELRSKAVIKRLHEPGAMPPPPEPED